MTEYLEYIKSTRSLKAFGQRVIKKSHTIGLRPDVKLLPTRDDEVLPIEFPPIGESRRIRPMEHLEESMSETPWEMPVVQGDYEQNPFTIPRNMNAYFKQKENDRMKKRLSTAQVSFRKKETVSSKQAKIALERVKPFLNFDYKPTQADVFKEVTWKAQTGLHITHLQKVSRKIHADYLAHRKQMFYMQRAIQTRQLALKTLKTSKEREESELLHYEYLTNLAANSLDEFLKDNDDKTVGASRETEKALQAKMDEVFKARQLNIRISQLKSEIHASNETLKECKSYMTFLDDITREVMRKDEVEINRDFRRQQQVKEQMIMYMKEGKTREEAEALIDEREQQFEEMRKATQIISNANTAGSTQFIKALNEEIHKLANLAECGAPEMNAANNVGSQNENVDDNTKQTVSSGVSKTAAVAVAGIDRPIIPIIVEESPKDDDGYDEEALMRSLDLVPGNDRSDNCELAGMSFTKPSQLLQIYADMEEANLSLLQHAQASEEALEQLQNQIRVTRKKLSVRGKTLRVDINEMQNSIDANEDRCREVQLLLEIFTSGHYDVKQQQKLFRLLRRHIAKVYRESVGNIDHHLNPKLMLTSIEKNFEELMKEIGNMPMDVVNQISRALDKERREDERLEKMAHRKLNQQERVSKAMERAEAPRVHKKGRPLYARSRPPKFNVQLSQAELDKKAEEDEFNYYFGP